MNKEEAIGIQVILARIINLCLAVDESCSLSDFQQLKEIARRLREDANNMQDYIKAYTYR